MKAKTSGKSEAWRNGRKGGRVRFPDITLAARELGVTRPHLYMVLSGTRESAVMRRRWEEWVRNRVTGLQGDRVTGIRKVAAKKVGAGEEDSGKRIEDRKKKGVAA